MRSNEAIEAHRCCEEYKFCTTCFEKHMLQCFREARHEDVRLGEIEVEIDELRQELDLENLNGCVPSSKASFSRHANPWIDCKTCGAVDLKKQMTTMLLLARHMPEHEL